MNIEEFEKEIQRDLYLRKIQIGEIMGPATGIPNIDKPWLKYFTEGQIKVKPINKTVYRYLYDENKYFQNDIAIIFMGKKIKYYELFAEVDKVARGLKQMGVKKGETVTICMPNTPESAYMFYACSKIGAIADFIDPRENEEGLEKYLNISNPKHLIMLDMCFDNFKDLVKKKKIENVVVTSPIESLPYPIMFGLQLKEKLGNRENYKKKIEFMKNSSTKYMSYKDFIKAGKNYTAEVEEEYEENRPVAIVHTGGTTGVPKGVLLSNDNLNELTSQLKNCDLQFIRHYLLMGVMPEFVGYGLSVGLHTSLVCGMKTMMIAKYEPEKIPELIMKYKPNCMAGSPAHWEIISSSPLIDDPKTDLSFFKGPIEGGDTLNLKVEERTNRVLREHGCKYKIQKGYGMTEKCSAATVCFNNEVNELGSVGVPFTKTNIAIYDNDNEQDLHYGEVGEICVNAPDVMLEYYNNKEETDNVIKTHADGKRWLHSGDLGYIDERGMLYVVGRIKDIIIRYDGIKIYPYNVESILLKHPQVESVAVIGISDPEHLNGEIPIAFPVFKENCDERVALSSLNDYAMAQVADYAVPTDYYPVESLPTTQVGKVDKKALKQSLEIKSGKIMMKKQTMI